MAGPIRISILANGSRARAELTRTAGTAGTMGRAFGKLGGIIAGAFAVREVARFTAGIVNAGSKFQGEMTRIQTQAGASAADVRKLSKSVLDLGGKVTQSPQDLADSLYHLKSVGLDNVKAMQALRAASKFASVGGADLESTTNALAGAWRSGVKGAGSFRKAVATMNAIIGAGNMKMEDLNAALGTGFLASAKGFGLNLKDVGSALALMTDEGVPAAAAATRLRMAFSLLGAPTAAAEKQLAAIGLTGKSLGVELRKGGIVGAIGLLKDHLKSLSKVDASQLLSRAFGGGRSSAAILTLINNFDVLRKKEKQVADTSDLSRFAKSVKVNAQTSEQVIGRFKSSFQTLGVEAGQALLPLVSKALIPLTKHLTDLIPAFQNLATTAKREFGPSFKLAGAVIRPFATLLEKIPGPMKSLALQAGLAALVMPRLAAGAATATGAIMSQVTSLRVLGLEMADTTARSRLLATGVARMGAALRSVAGVAGFVAITDAAHRSNAALSTLEMTAGAAAVGFSLGGPWGAAVGAAVGGGASIYKSVKHANDALDAQAKAMDRLNGAMDGSKPHLADYAHTLDQVTGAATAATRASVLQKLQQDGIIAQAKTLGLSARTLVSATLGQTGALSKVNRSWKQHQDLLSLAGRSNVLNWINNQNAAFDRQREKIQGDSAAVQHYSSRLLHQLPKAVRTDVKLNGVKPNLADIARLTHKYRLTPKQIRTLIQLSGAKTSVKAVESVQKSLKNTARIKADPKAWLGSMASAYGTALRQSKTSSGKVQKSLKGAGDVKVNASSWVGSILTATNRAKVTASTGSRGVGTNLRSGILAGTAGTGSALASILAAAVNRGLAAARAAADAHSPSRKMIKLGHDLADGLTLGVAARRAGFSKATRNLILSAVKAAKQGGQDLARALRSSFETSIKRSHPKAVKEYTKQLDRLLKSDVKQRKALIDKGRHLDKVNAKYKTARDRIKDLVTQQKQYAADVKASVVASADVTQLNSPFTPAGVVAGLQHAVDKAKQYAALIKSLRDQHLNKTSLRQLLDAGVQGGLATAQAIASGGKATIAQVNTLTGQLNATGKNLGTSMGHTMYDAGIKAAQGLANGLKSRQKQLQRQFEKMATALVTTIKKKLKIHSPSQVFADIGKQSVAGLRIGLDNTYVKRSGAVLAASLVKGFGDPRLSATSALASAQGPAGTNVIRIELSAQQLSQLQRGRLVQADLDAYHRSGGRPRAS